MLWVLTLLLVLLVLSILFGGFQRGTKVGGTDGHRVRPDIVAARATPH
ncbi:MAG: hypothetical protein ACRDPO_33015 [Streptosporangiaceae bacterium]